jgi:TfoX/Sxy family transcriptional regulator of competence genes
MAYNEKLTIRLREALSHVSGVEEKKMFGGVMFMVNGKMCISAGDDEIMCRIDPALYDDAIQQEGCRPVVMQGRIYKGYIYVNEKAIPSKEDLNHWVELALNFNEHAKASVKRKK